MKWQSLAAVSLLCSMASCSSLKSDGPIRSISSTPICENLDSFTLAVHGGVGYVANPSQREVLKKILSDGHQMLKDGVRGIDVVQNVVEQMENSGLFNAGRGGTRTNIKTVELDSSIMDGRDLSAGAVASVKDVKNPIRLARAVKDQTNNVFIVSEGASLKAKEFGLDLVTPDYYVGVAPLPGEKVHYGTVGAVVRDRCGDLAAGTSTGGLYNKPRGRVGDSPIIGGGTYANNLTCAVSATGDGEKFIRASVGSRISSILQYTDRSLKSAVDEALDLVKELKGGGGVISVDKKGQVYWSTTDNAPMPRGLVREDGVVVVMDPSA